MARTWSVCLREIAAQKDAIADWWHALADRAFLPVAVLAHLCVSLFGGANILTRMAVADDPGRVLFDPSVLLFILAGGITALLLPHANEPAPPQASSARPAPDEINCTPPERGALAKASGLDAFDGLLHHVGHELRTPLNAIIGFAELMQRELLGPLGSPRYQEYARHIRESGVTLLKAAEDVMALTTLLADREVRYTEGMHADRLVSEACNAADAGARGIHIMRGAACYATVDAEPAAMRQALSTLISSAAKGAPEKRPIAVTTRVVGGSVRVSIALGRDTHAQDNLPAEAQSSMAVARMLLELQGAVLTDYRSRDGSRRLTAALPLAREQRYSANAVRAGARLHPQGHLGRELMN
ncbi:MAG: sensor histidine kinase [Hyphomicrobiaceae bacterium]